jgi:hypothetical protein
MHSKQLLPSNLHDQQISMLRNLNLVSMAQIKDYQTIVICPTMPELHWHIIFSTCCIWKNEPFFSNGFLHDWNQLWLLASEHLFCSSCWEGDTGATHFGLKILSNKDSCQKACFLVSYPWIQVNRA